MIRFQHVEYLWLLFVIPLIVILYLYYLNWRKVKLNKLGEAALVRQLVNGKISGRATTKLVLGCLALTCGILGLANLQAGGHPEKTQRKGIDVLFALDVSKSMLARDVNPDRLSRAKELIFRMVDKMKNDRAGLVVFAGKAYLQVPLTIDYSAMKMLLASVDPGMIPTQGTVLADAIDLADASFSQNEKKHKVIILISDGEDHDERALAAAKAAREKGAVIYTVGVGSPQGSPIFDPTTGQNKVDKNGETVISKLNEAELQGLAQATGGSYQLLNNANQAAQHLVTDIDQMETKNLGTVVYTDYQSYFQYFLGAALLFLLAGWLLPDARLLLPHKPLQGAGGRAARIILLILSIATLSTQQASAQQKAAPEPRKELREGNALYLRKDYKAAQRNYEQALQKNPHSFTGNFNLGDALYQSNQTDAARSALEQSIQSTTDKKQQAAAYHNIGNTFLKEQKWEDAINAYKQSLKLNASDADTKYNLAYAQAMLKKDRQNQNKNNKGQKNQDQQKQQNKNGDKNKDQQDKNQDKNKDQKNQQGKDQNQDNPDKNQNPDNGKSGDQEPPRQQPQPSKLTRQQADNILNALSQEEKKLHDQKEKGNGVPVQLEKDW